MDIRYFAQRSQAFAALSGRPAAADDKTQAAAAAQNSQPVAAAQPASDVAPTDTDKDATPATEATAQQPATLPRFSPAGRLLNVLQSVEQQHPDETKQVLSNIADKLRADSEHAGVFSDRLSKWADRFQQAADSGDMSNLMPRLNSHFGMRAYQQNQQTAPDADETVEHVAGVAAQHAAKGGDRPSTVSAPATTPASTSTAPQQSTLSGDNVQSTTTPPIAVTDRATAVAAQ